jgi:hypothetical protein
MDPLIFSILAREGGSGASAFRFIGYDWVGRPAWFFWLKDRPGAYHLQERSHRAANARQAVSFTLRYYPDPAERAFAGYSVSEQLLRVSPFFQRPPLLADAPAGAIEEAHHHAPAHLPASDPGIPAPEERARLHPRLFAVGAMILVWIRDALRGCVLEAPVRSITRATHDLVLPRPGAGEPVRVLQAGEVDRDLPCWEEIAMAFCAAFLQDLRLSCRRQAETWDRHTNMRRASWSLGYGERRQCA